MLGRARNGEGELGTGGGEGASETVQKLDLRVMRGHLPRYTVSVYGMTYEKYDSLIWYANTVGFDLEFALNVIHAMPKIYEK